MMTVFSVPPRSTVFSVACSLALTGALMGWSRQGVPTADNPAPNPNAPSFRLSAPPLITVGGLNDDARYEIISIGDAALLESGQLVIVPSDRVTFGIARVFAPPGRFVRSIGRRGQGPGEFGYIGQILPRGRDSVLLYDADLHRTSLFDATGTLVKVTPGVKLGICCFSDGATVIGTSHNVYVSSPTASMLGDSLRLYVAPGLRGGAPPDTTPDGKPRKNENGIVGGPEGRPILTVRGREAAIRIAAVDPRTGTPMTFGQSRPFARSPIVAISGQTIIYADQERYEYRVYDRSGTPLRIVRAVLAPAVITARDVEVARTEWTGGSTNGSARPGTAAAWNRLILPKTMPAFGDILTEEDGTVWVGSYALSETDQWWARFDTSGHLAGTLRVPAGLRVFRFTRGHVILRRVNMDGTMTIFVHRVERV
jgi:hypothetical protein